MGEVTVVRTKSYTGFIEYLSKNLSDDYSFNTYYNIVYKKSKRKWLFFYLTDSRPVFTVWFLEDEIRIEMCEDYSELDLAKIENISKFYSGKTDKNINIIIDERISL